jgi:hypothetical protein
VWCASGSSRRTFGPNAAASVSKTELMVSILLGLYQAHFQRHGLAFKVKASRVLSLPHTLQPPL